MMFFTNLFAPKWKHTNAEVRRQALQALDEAAPESQRILAEVAKTDAQGSIRQLAIRRLQEPGALLALLRDPAQGEVHEVAGQRLAQLIAGVAVSALTPEQRRATLDRIEEQRVLELVAQSTSETDLILALLPRLQRQGLLGDLALNAAQPEVREAALERVTQRSTLERVVNASRRSDKRIHALSAARLEAIKAEEERPERIKAEAKRLLRELEALAQSAKKFRTWLLKEHAYRELCRRWDENRAAWRPETDGAWNEQMSAEFAELRAGYDSGLERQRAEEAVRQAEEARLAPLRAGKTAVIDALSAALRELEGCSAPREDQATALASQLAAAHEDWRRCEPLPEAEERGLRQRYEELRTRLQDLAGDAARYHTSLAMMKTFSAELRELTAAETVPDTRQLKRLVARRDEIQLPVHFKLPSELVEAVRGDLAALQSRVEQQTQQREADVKEFKSLVPSLEQALAEGRFKAAANWARRGQKLLQGFDEAQSQRLKSDKLATRFHAAFNQVRELEDWREWSNVPARVTLCEDMERLAQQLQVEGNEIDPKLAVERIKEARREWRQYDTREVDQTSEVWQRFDAACNAIHEICQGRFSDERARQQANKAAREAVCANLERLYAEKIAEGAAVDIKALEQIIRVADEEWRALGSVAHREWKPLSQRYHHAIDQLRKVARLDRKRHLEAKQALIRQAEAVVAKQRNGELALPAAIEQIKQLQVQWREIGPANKEGELWREFRAACGAVFGERQAQRDAKMQALQEQLAGREALCAEIERLGALEGDALKGARADFDRLQQQWKEAGEVPKAQRQAIEARYQAACQAFAEANARRLQAERAAYQALEDSKLALCRQVEAWLSAVCEGRPAEALTQAELTGAWDALPGLAAEDEALLRQRFHQGLARLEACRAGDAQALTEAREAMQNNLVDRQRLCLHMEILAGIDSPPAAQQQRLAYQVELLAEKLKSGAAHDKRDEARMLERRWRGIGVTSPAALVELEQRFERARAAIIGSG
ncbi:MAG: DUF349 domain-containing protein [Pseudomonadota bacterium]